MDTTEMTDFLRALKKEPELRSHSDIQSLYFTLRSFTCLDRFDDNTIYAICAKNCFYLKKQANDILYCRGEIAQSWYILISGSVFIDGSMFLPITSFGRRGTQNSIVTRRPNECLILEPSEMICVDYESNRQSISSSSSAYSGSDTMLSSNSGNIDLSGLLESVVDSNSESDSDSDSNYSLETSIRDTVRECLEKDPTERNEQDIQVLLEFTQHLNSFNNLTLSVRKALCQSMVFAVVEKAGTIVLSNNEELDSWSVLVNGSVEIIKESSTTILTTGDSFGLPPTLDKQYFEGLMRTKVDDCQFVCVTQSDYFRILKQSLDSQKTVKNEEGKTILVYESRSNQSAYNSWVIIRGSKEALIEELFKQENGSVDPTFVEDFLLTQRIFMDIKELADIIVKEFGDRERRDRVIRVMLLWVNNHFIDFEVDEGLMGRLVRFHSLLEQTTPTLSTPNSIPSGQLRLLQIACSAKSRPRTITLSRPSRDDPLPFNIMGGAENGYGVFISSIEGINNLRIGDELLTVNNVNFRSINLAKAFEVLRGATHLVLVVKCNFLGYHECITSSAPLLPIPSSSGTLKFGKSYKNKESRFRRALGKVHLLPRKPIGFAEERPEIVFPENVLKVYRPDQSYKYLLVNKETTSREVTMLTLTDPNLPQINSREYALFQTTVSNHANNYFLKQTKLPDNLDSLAERLPLGSRYYIKKIDSTEPLIPNELLQEIHKEGEVTFLNLNPTELALQLTLEDYACFRQIEMTEFIDDLFNLESNYGTPNLNQFAQLVNRETFWVVSEVVQETSVGRRVAIIKRFLKVALTCKECRNFNSMFAIVSGLGHSAVGRLKGTWDKITRGKWGKVFGDLQDLMDPSRNMYRYRSLLSSSFATPMIPFYPVVKKDLTFIDLGNSSKIDNLINFEKMRMVSKEIRNLIQMSAAPFDTSSLASVAAMNQLSNNNSRLTTTTGKKTKNKKNQNSQPNPKKMYEEMNMIRKVKAYLSRLVIIQDENHLHELSLLCEGKVKRPGSPTSLNSSERVKFGSSSPGSYQKLMALSDGQKAKKNFEKSASSMSLVSVQSGSSSKSIPKSLNLNTESSSVLPGKL